MQTLRRIGKERGIVKLTTATYYTPSWRRIEPHRDHGEDHEEAGIAPDVLVELADEERGVVYEFLTGYSPPAIHVPTIERWELSENVELIPDQPADRQLEAAVALLDGRVAELHADLHDQLHETDAH